MMEKRTGWRGQNESRIVEEERRSGRLVGAAEISKELAEWRRLQRKNLSILGLLKIRVASVPQREQLASTPEEKKQSRLSKVPHRMMVEWQGEREPHHGERGGSAREYGEERVHFTVKEGRFQEAEGRQVRRATLGEEGSMSE